MKNTYLILLISISLFSCGNERTLILPEIENAKITELHDVSHAYLFYDETKKDSIDLNRKNLISTTNWLVNVDKRLTLEQAIPKIKLLQDKKRNAKMHKNEAAKNYYTCNDTTIKNLGFLEFTDVFYRNEKSEEFFKQSSKTETEQIIFIHFNSTENIDFEVEGNGSNTIQSNKEFFANDFKMLGVFREIKISPVFKKSLLFQDYITFKSMLSKLESDSISIDNNEFIY